MYDGCGYDARAVARDAKCEADAVRRLEKELGDDASREACKTALVKAVARLAGRCEGCLARKSDRDFLDAAVSAVRGGAKRRIC